MSDKKRILLVDDDDALREALAEQMAAETDLEIVEAGNIADGRELASANYFDAIVLDVGLPDGDGRELCRELREKHDLSCPIIMLTANDSEEDTIRGLDAGANDYVSKPFKIGVLMARLRAHLRQFETSGEAHLAVGPYDFQPAKKILKHRETGRDTRLTEKEVNILRYLYRADPPLVSREELLGEVWGYSSEVTTHTLETHIYRLRQKIEEDPSNAAIIVTGPGGYQLGGR